jgi:hypothetical protein
MDTTGNLLIRNNFKGQTSLLYDAPAGNMIGGIINFSNVSGSDNPNANFFP